MRHSQPIVYLVLKRLRAPLILLIVAWTVSMLGLTLIPGVEIDGERRYLTIFEAFYFVSYMATTIGFGEPHFGFTDTQRLWVSFSMYLTVVSWLFAIGNIISLLQDPALQSVWKKQRFTKRVSRIDRKFCIICGYGETGELLLEYLSEKGYQCVVIDNDSERINLLDLNQSLYSVPYLQGDVSDVETLKMAGLGNPNCRAILAMTNNDRVNVKIAATAKVLQSSVKVICRAKSQEAMANAKSFDTDHVLNPNRLFAEGISRAFRTPSIQQVWMSLLRRNNKDFIKAINPPKGHWIVCGYGDFGREMVKFFDFEGIDYTLISHDDSLSIPHIHGKGTEAVTLRAADIDKAVGIVAGIDDDTDNFSIIMTARHLKPNLFFIAQQNQDSNRLIFQHAEIDAVMESARLMVWYIIPLVTQPKLALFLRLARHQDEAWGQELMQRLQAVSDKVPSTYLIKINERKAPSVIQHLASGNILRLQDLYVDDKEQPDRPIAMPLMLIRDGKEELLPKMSMAIKNGDVFLMASKLAARDQILYTIQHDQDFHYVIHGEEKPVSIVMDKVKKYLKDYKSYRRQKRKTKAAQAVQAAKTAKVAQEMQNETLDKTAVATTVETAVATTVATGNKVDGEK